MNTLFNNSLEFVKNTASYRVNAQGSKFPAVFESQRVLFLLFLPLCAPSPLSLLCILADVVPLSYLFSKL